MTQNQNGRHDARSITQGVRSGWFKPVRATLVERQKRRTRVTTRAFLVATIRDHANAIRGAVRPSGLRAGRAT